MSAAPTTRARSTAGKRLRRLLIQALAGGTLGALAAGAAGQALRDPTRPPQARQASQASSDPTPVLSAVLDFGGTRRAIFNGQLVHGGSAVGGYIIDEVLADGVRYRRGGEVHELHLLHQTSSVKKPATETTGAPNGVEP
jgi:hypothetical protein